MERAFHLARTAHDGAESVLTIGHSHEADQAWVSDLLAVRLPLYPNLAIRLISQFSIELVRSVLAGELNLALVTAPPKDSQIEASPFVLTPLYAVLPEGHAAAEKEQLVLQDLAKDEWILFTSRVTPSFTTQSWTRLDVRESRRNAGTTSLRRKKRFTSYLSTLEWPFSRNLRPLAFASKV